MGQGLVTVMTMTPTTACSETVARVGRAKSVVLQRHLATVLALWKLLLQALMGPAP